MLTGTFDPAEVTLLLTDLSAHDLERDLAEREARMQAGRSYAEVLPVEYVPTADYLALFDELLQSQAAAVARAVGVLAELLVHERGDGLVLVSLARAGTPIGVLLRRWLQQQHRLDVPHYSVSIVRGSGLDEQALDWLVARHPPEALAFVDGWTGKGAIAGELSAAVGSYAASRRLPLDGRLAAVADPGRCATWFGTRADLLVPSACLNATVCGLVSRTVLRPDLTGASAFHGAKVYTQLRPHDRTADFLDTMTAAFADVAAEVDATWSRVAAGDRACDAAGSEVVRRLRADYELPSEHLVKPGVGETTRVLLRRLPWQVLVAPGAADRLPHLTRLAAERGVGAVERPDLGPYQAVGIVRPVLGAG